MAEEQAKQVQAQQRQNSLSFICDINFGPQSENDEEIKSNHNTFDEKCQNNYG